MLPIKENLINFLKSLPLISILKRSARLPVREWRRTPGVCTFSPLTFVFVLQRLQREASDFSSRPEHDFKTVLFEICSLPNKNVVGVWRFHHFPEVVQLNEQRADFASHNAAAAAGGQFAEQSGS